MESQQPGQEENLSLESRNRLEACAKSLAELDKMNSEILKLKWCQAEDMKALFVRLGRVMQEIETNLRLLLEVLHLGPSATDDVSAIKKKYEAVSIKYETLKKRSDISLTPLNHALDNGLKGLLTHTEQYLKLLLASKKNKTKSSSKIVQILIVTPKFETFIEFFAPLVLLPKKHLFSQGKSEPNWKLLQEKTDFRLFKNKPAVEAAIKKFLGLIHVPYASVKKKEDPKPISLLSMTSIYYNMNKKKASVKAALYLSDPKIESAFQVWNMLERKALKQLVKMNLPSFSSDKKIYVPKLFPSITKESVLKEYMNGDLQKVKVNSFQAPDLVSEKEEVLKTIFRKDTSRVKIRILSPNPWDIKSGNSNPKKQNDISGVVIHVHGGGFVAMSSSSHRNYLYRWAKGLNMVIFSIDYRLAPESPYPAGLDDVWQAYNWLVNYSETILGIPTNKIILAGDSAGGNYITVLAMKAIKEGVRVPDGLYLCYPALNLSLQRIFPSYLLALDDQLLPYNLLKLCLKAYVPEDFKPDVDPLLSPVTADDEILSRFPPVRILSGTNDPLHDDIWYFSDRLLQLKRDLKITVYDGLPHGFFAFDQMKEYKDIIAESVERIKELVHN